MPPIRTLVPPGGFSNLVGYYVAALDMGLEQVKDAARHSADAKAAADVLRRIGALEGRWVHGAVGAAPTPAAPEAGADLEAWLGWLEAVRTVSVMVLRPLADRDLERLVDVGAAGEPQASGPRTLKRLLSELLFRQGRLCGRLED